MQGVGSMQTKFTTLQEALDYINDSHNTRIVEYHLKSHLRDGIWSITFKSLNSGWNEI